MDSLFPILGRCAHVLHSAMAGVRIVLLAGVIAPALSSAAARTYDLNLVVRLSIGQEHACAVRENGEVRCWGNNPFGQLGTGDTRSSDTAVAVPALSTGVSNVAVGLSHTCAVESEGDVRCWGSNFYGELGDGTLVPRSTPGLRAVLPRDAIAVSAGVLHSCALLDDQTVWCWGRNDRGQLGDDSAVDRSTPVAVTGLAGPVQWITLGASHSCAQMLAGGVSCWGDNATGQLGDGTTTSRSTAQPVVDLPGAVSILSTGTSHNCAIVPTHGAYCWGAGASGNLGDGSSDLIASRPVAVQQLPSIPRWIAAGRGHSCASFLDRSVYCWGSNARGELGRQSAIYMSPIPARVELLDLFERVVAGDTASCALGHDGRPTCWGGNLSGVLGDGTRSLGRTPTRVATREAIVELSVGDAHACARNDSGNVSCWGSNESTQLGDGTGRHQFAPSTVHNLGGLARTVDAGFAHTCAVLLDGSVTCWGLGAFGALGDDSLGTSATPVTVHGLKPQIVAVSSGSQFNCALSAAGSVECWGANFSGQLGNSKDLHSATPIGVTDLSDGVVAISTGAAHACALTDAPAIECWGGNFFGQLGRGAESSSGTPDAVPDLAAAPIAVEASKFHTCALLVDGRVQCWGLNEHGQLGDQTTTNRSRPVTVTGLPGPVSRLALGYAHTCAVTTGGEAWCWGGNSAGIFGDGTTSNHALPVRVGVLNQEVAAIAASQTFACATMTNGTARCWGTNFRGELGVGGRDNSVPGRVQEADLAQVFTDAFEFFVD